MQQPPERGHYHRPILTRTKASAATTDDDDEEEGVDGEFLPLLGKNGILWEFLLEGWGCRW